MNNKITFLEAISIIKKKYKIESSIIFTILFSLSKKIKNLNQFSTFKKEMIDFSFNTLIKKILLYKKEKKPLAKIVKSIKFLNLNIQVDGKNFAPRDETEIFCNELITFIKKTKFNSRKLKGVDLCCGTGVIGLALKKNFPNIEMFAIDIDSYCIRNTILNAKKNRIKIKTYIGDFFETLIKKKIKSDLIVCNPPYVEKEKINNSYMLKHEKKIAFSNNDDYLYFYRKIIYNYKKIINDTKKFIIAFEFGKDQKKYIKKIISENNLLKYTKFYKDFQSHDRFFIIAKNIP
ncbi:MAG: HemK family protein methyltransferase [Mycoplasmataceae bacterium]|jgi:release factor glutamine methyltransferase|nr:HemK family protein methyltransferase [Mycoplasmataceae bacterium]